MITHFETKEVDLSRAFHYAGKEKISPAAENKYWRYITYLRAKWKNQENIQATSSKISLVGMTDILATKILLLSIQEEQFWFLHVNTVLDESITLRKYFWSWSPVSMTRKSNFIFRQTLYWKYLWCYGFNNTWSYKIYIDWDFWCFSHYWYKIVICRLSCSSSNEDVEKK